MKDNDDRTGQRPVGTVQDVVSGAGAQALQQRMRTRRRLLQWGSGAVLMLPVGLVLAGRDSRPAAPRPLIQSQRLLVIDFVTTLSQLMATYVLAGMGGKADAGSTLASTQIETHRKRADLLARRLPRELRHQLPAPAQEALQARWRTVADACRTRPSLDIARLMLPMAREISTPLLNLLPAADTRTRGGGEGRARRRLMLARLQAEGLVACWVPGLVDWKAVTHEREQLGAWVQTLAHKNAGGVRLTAQWNLFASAFPLPNTQCVGGAADTLASTGDRLNALL